MTTKNDTTKQAAAATAEGKPAIQPRVAQQRIGLQIEWRPRFYQDRLEANGEGLKGLHAA